MNHLLPSVFQWGDFLTFGLLAIAGTVLGALAVANYRLNPTKTWWQWAGLALVVGLFWFGYGTAVKWRAQLVERVACVTQHGLILVEDGGVMPSCKEVEAATWSLILAWNRAGIDAEGVMADGVMVFVKPLPFQLHTKPERFAGFAKPHANAIAIGSDGRPVVDTALGHELGHLILSRSGRRADEQSLKDYHDHYGVPY